MQKYLIGSSTKSCILNAAKEEPNDSELIPYIREFLAELPTSNKRCLYLLLNHWKKVTDSPKYIIDLKTMADKLSIFISNEAVDFQYATLALECMIFYADTLFEELEKMHFTYSDITLMASNSCDELLATETSCKNAEISESNSKAISLDDFMLSQSARQPSDNNPLIQSFEESVAISGLSDNHFANLNELYVHEQLRDYSEGEQSNSIAAKPDENFNPLSLSAKAGSPNLSHLQKEIDPDAIDAAFQKQIISMPDSPLDELLDNNILNNHIDLVLQFEPIQSNIDALINVDSISRVDLPNDGLKYANIVAENDKNDSQKNFVNEILAENKSLKKQNGIMDSCGTLESNEREQSRYEFEHQKSSSSLHGVGLLLNDSTAESIHHHNRLNVKDIEEDDNTPPSPDNQNADSALHAEDNLEDDRNSAIIEGSAYDQNVDADPCAEDSVYQEDYRNCASTEDLISEQATPAVDGMEEDDSAIIEKSADDESSQQSSRVENNLNDSNNEIIEGNADDKNADACVEDALNSEERDSSSAIIEGCAEVQSSDDDNSEKISGDILLENDVNQEGYNRSEECKVNDNPLNDAIISETEIDGIMPKDSDHSIENFFSFDHAFRDSKGTPPFEDALEYQDSGLLCLETSQLDLEAECIQGLALLKQRSLETQD